MSREFETEFCITCENKFTLEDVITECKSCWNKQNKWIKCTDKLPEFEVEVLTYQNGYISTGKYHDYHQIVTENGWTEKVIQSLYTDFSDPDFMEPMIRAVHPTHWMPLHEPPK